MGGGGNAANADEGEATTTTTTTPMPPPRETTGVPAFANAVHAEKMSVADITPKDFEKQYVTRGMPLARMSSIVLSFKTGNIFYKKGAFTLIITRRLCPRLSALSPPTPEQQRSCKPRAFKTRANEKREVSERRPLACRC